MSCSACSRRANLKRSCKSGSRHNPASPFCCKHCGFGQPAIDARRPRFIVNPSFQPLPVANQTLVRNVYQRIRVEPSPGRRHQKRSVFAAKDFDDLLSLPLRWPRSERRVLSSSIGRRISRLSAPFSVRPLNIVSAIFRLRSSGSSL